MGSGRPHVHVQARTSEPRLPLSAAERALRNELREAIRRTGWTETARRMGVDRTALHRSFSENCQRQHGIHLATVLAVAQALGFNLSLTSLAA